MMEFLGEEVDGALIAQRIHGESTDNSNYIPSVAALHVSSKQPGSGRKGGRKGESFCVLRGKGSLGPRMQESDVSDRPERETEVGTLLFSLLKPWPQRESLQQTG